MTSPETGGTDWREHAIERSPLAILAAPSMDASRL
jgi:hypothetical protein